MHGSKQRKCQFDTDLYGMSLRTSYSHALQRPNMTPQNGLGLRSKISKQKLRMIENVVPGGGQTAPFRGVWRVLGGFLLLGRFWCRSPPSPESLLAASWGCWDTFWPPSCRSRHILKITKRQILVKKPLETLQMGVLIPSGCHMEASWFQNSFPLGPCL